MPSVLSDLHHERRGCGPAVLFISGASGDAGHFARVGERLADEFTTVAYDRRGCSRSARDGEAMSIAAQADDAAALIEELGLAPAIVFGTSGGGDIALELVARRPELVRGAIVHEPAVEPISGHHAPYVQQPDAFAEELRPILRDLSRMRRVNGIRLYCEEHGSGAPILCIHGAGSTALAWADAIDELARLGRVIAYDRRGCARSERPQPYERTSVAEHADDAAALLDAVAATPAIVVGRSYGGTVAIDLALRYPDRVRALVLLEPDAPRELAPAVAAWVDALAGRLRQVAAREGVDAVASALIREVAGEDSWRSLPAEIRRILTGNGPAILAELAGEWWLQADAAALAGIQQPALLVAAADSSPAGT